MGSRNLSRFGSRNLVDPVDYGSDHALRDAIAQPISELIDQRCIELGRLGASHLGRL